jgi:flagella basal body P-ring formation protein FlgA
VPLIGRTGTVTQGYVRLQVRQLNLDAARFKFAGAQLCSVTRPEQILAGAETEKAALEAVRAEQQELDVLSNYTPLDQRLPVGKVEMRPLTPQLFGTTSGTIPVQVLVDGKQEASVTVSFRLVRKTPAVVAVRDLPIGTVLCAEDLAIRDRAAVPGPLLISTVDRAIGRQVTSPIKSGATLLNSMLQSATLVKRDTRGPSMPAGRGS